MTGDGLGRGLSDMWRSVVLIVPAVLAFAAILLIGWLVARLLRVAVCRGLHRAGLDRAVARGAAGRLFAPGGTTPSELCGKLAFAAALLFAAQLAFGVWGPNPVSSLLTDLIGWLPRLLVAIVLVVVAAAVARAAEDLVVGALGGLPYGRFVARATSLVIVTLGVIAALDQVRVATAITRPVLIAVLATVAGVLIVGVGGGLVRPMQSRWESWLTLAATESAQLRDHLAARPRTDAESAERRDHLAGWTGTDATRLDIHAASESAHTGFGNQHTASAGVHADETQVIPPPRHEPGADDTVAVITTTAVGTTIVNPGPNDTILIGSGTEDGSRTEDGSGIDDTESTQVIPSAARSRRTDPTSD
ncbi:hypothetical protein LXN57_15615 [Actinoplanes sp. TRM88002]|uniref:Transporter (Transmembrane protein) n=1 Tax=Paractinoplanes hotanensis TaxID=2906497 RepID=A0ABT0XYX9_9ACTN|nr:hypothetical protein [Actinoplanes hotanensis]MCM4079000.1 hypothetical protein [Actinoplanes hotanensis]